VIFSVQEVTTIHFLLLLHVSWMLSVYRTAKLQFRQLYWHNFHGKYYCHWMLYCDLKL